LNITGTPKRIILDGVTYSCKADAAPTKQSRTKNEPYRHTGGVGLKQTLQIPHVKAFSIEATSAQFEELEDLAARQQPFPMSFELADGSVYRSAGTINLGDHAMTENKVDVEMFPVDEWALFAP